LGLVAGFVTAPDNCGLECIGRPIGYMVGGAGVGLVVGFGVALSMGGGSEDAAEIRVALRTPSFF
jgi:hypothetical protein